MAVVVKFITFSREIWGNQATGSAVHQVMKALGDGDVPKAFPLHSQYVPNMKASREAAAEGEGDDHAIFSSGDEGSEKPQKTKKRKTKDAKTAIPSESPWNYSSIRKSFIDAARNEKGLKYKEAKDLWDNSQEKRDFLAPIPLAELKRRKFVEKTCNANPWAKLP